MRFAHGVMERATVTSSSCDAVSFEARSIVGWRATYSAIVGLIGAEAGVVGSTHRAGDRPHRGQRRAEVPLAFARLVRRRVAEPEHLLVDELDRETRRPRHRAAGQRDVAVEVTAEHTREPPVAFLERSVLRVGDHAPLTGRIGLADLHRAHVQRRAQRRHDVREDLTHVASTPESARGVGEMVGERPAPVGVGLEGVGHGAIMRARVPRFAKRGRWRGRCGRGR